ncbi:M28 family peptidase [Aureitalea marina]|uniref:Aminopeptidase n=1 Tax=Aureitalea marina TaxID=930804 RepID=A0A2S7KQK9_9FLAO|nr:M28 family peptidase [Aureitalea marina]PQB04906.1 aminopeptidase [Aureitalea marina]
MKQLITVMIMALFTVAGWTQTDMELAQSTVTQDKIKGHIYFLADDLLEGRETGTQGNKIAAAYLANTLRSYGVKPNPESGNFYQEVILQKTTPHTRIELKLGGKAVKNTVVLAGNKINYTGGAVFVGHGLEDDYKGKNVKGKIVFMRAGGPDGGTAQQAFRLRKQKEALAKEKGAISMIEFLQAEENMWGYIEHNFNTDRLGMKDPEKIKKEQTVKGEMNFTYLWIKDEFGQLAVNMEKNPEQPVQLLVSGSQKIPVKTQNVIGWVEGTDPELKNEFIIYSAHYDHVGIGTPDETGDAIYNGARDNAVGTTTVLSMAENLAKHPTKRSALFILFTGEEKGLLGSKYYVENPVLPLNQMVYCFNSDNGGYNDTSLATIIGLPRTTAEQNIKDAVSAFGLTAIDDPAAEQGLFDRSDNVNFAAVGIPAPTFSLGFRSFDGEVTKYYHQPGDHADSMDYDYLEKFFKSYVLAGRMIANDPQTPFWTAGDKYEEAGKELYQVSGVKN